MVYRKEGEKKTIKNLIWKIFINQRKFFRINKTENNFYRWTTIDLTAGSSCADYSSKNQTGLSINFLMCVTGRYKQISHNLSNLKLWYKIRIMIDVCEPETGIRLLFGHWNDWNVMKLMDGKGKLKIFTNNLSKSELGIL